MIATTKYKAADLPGDIDLLLPWFVTGRLSTGEARRVRAALVRDPRLARDYAAIREEYNETIQLHDALGGPSSRAMHNLFAAIESEPPRRHEGQRGAARGLAVLSPRLLVVAAVTALIVLLVQAVMLGVRVL
jgi:anti-sigma factor RsiW